MKRRRRTRILIDGDAGLRRELARQIMDAYRLADLEPARDALVMIKMRETARQSLFYLGELLVTEARVRIGESVGLGIVAGNQPEAARELAIIDAAFNAELPESRSWLPRLLAEEARLHANRVEREERILETRVRFETMDTE